MQHTGGSTSQTVFLVIFIRWTARLPTSAGTWTQLSTRYTCRCYTRTRSLKPHLTLHLFSQGGNKCESLNGQKEVTSHNFYMRVSKKYYKAQTFFFRTVTILSILMTRPVCFCLMNDRIERANLGSTCFIIGECIECVFISDSLCRARAICTERIRPPGAVFVLEK